jgi:hypothetical protein
VSVHVWISLPIRRALYTIPTGRQQSISSYRTFSWLDWRRDVENYYITSLELLTGKGLFLPDCRLAERHITLGASRNVRYTIQQKAIG